MGLWSQAQVRQVHTESQTTDMADAAEDAKRKEELNASLKEYIAEWRKTREAEEDELAKLKEKQAKRKEIRAEQEKKLNAAKKEEEKMKKEEAERKAKGLDPEALTGKYPPKIRMYSKYERRTDTRSYDDRKKMYEGGWEVVRAEHLEASWKEKHDEWSKRPAKKLPKWFGERPGKKAGAPETPEGEEEAEGAAPEEEDYDEEEEEEEEYDEEEE